MCLLPPSTNDLRRGSLASAGFLRLYGLLELIPGSIDCLLPDGSDGVIAELPAFGAGSRHVERGLPDHANRSCTTTSDRASWPPFGMAGFTALPTAIMNPITWSLGRLMISATFTGSKPIIGQES